MPGQLHNMTDYDEECARFSIEAPEFFNFGFEVINAWANKNRNKLAMIWTNHWERRRSSPSGISRSFRIGPRYHAQVQGEQGAMVKAFEVLIRDTCLLGS